MQKQDSVYLYSRFSPFQTIDAQLELISQAEEFESNRESPSEERFKEEPSIESGSEAEKFESTEESPSEERFKEESSIEPGSEAEKFESTEESPSGERSEEESSIESGSEGEEVETIEQELLIDQGAENAVYFGIFLVVIAILVTIWMLKKGLEGKQ